MFVLFCVIRGPLPTVRCTSVIYRYYIGRQDRGLEPICGDINRMGHRVGALGRDFMCREGKESCHLEITKLLKLLINE